MLAQSLMRGLVIGLSIVVSVAALGGQFGAWHWIGDVLALASEYYLWLALFLSVALLALRAWRWVPLLTVVALLCAWQIVDYPRAVVVPNSAARASATPANAAPASMRVMVYNIYYLNTDLDAVVREVRQHNPDLVFLMEYSDAIKVQLDRQFPDYPYQLIQPSRFTMGLALLSRIPFTAQVVHRNQDTRIPIYDIQFEIGGQRVTFVGGHPWPPQPQWGQLHRDQLQAIIDVAAAAPAPKIVAGDFNAAPWSAMLRRMANSAGVLPVRNQFDFSRTWGAPPAFGLTLDHIYVSSEWQVQDYGYGAPGGSDHLPLIVDLRLTP